MRAAPLVTRLMHVLKDQCARFTGRIQKGLDRYSRSVRWATRRLKKEEPA